MKKAVEFSKNVILTIGGVVWLFTVVYFSALGFMAAILADKGFKAIGSKLTVQQIIDEMDAAVHHRYEEYRHSWDNFHLKNIKLPF